MADWNDSNDDENPNKVRRFEEFEYEDEVRKEPN
jgi:hypothetical protein